MSRTEVRPMLPSDVNYLCNLDLRYSEFHWNKLSWQQLDKLLIRPEVMVGTIDHTPETYMIYEPPVSKEDKVCKVIKFVYSPKALSSELILNMIQRVENRALKTGAHCVMFFLSETECRGPSDPYDRTGILLEHGYKFFNKSDKTFEAYGEKWDILTFQKKTLLGEQDGKA